MATHNRQTAAASPGGMPQAGDGRLSLRNTRSGYGLVAILLHWIVALTVLGLFILGLWMVDLTYYDAWYHRAPEIHKSIGVLLFLVLLGRLLWRLLNPSPTDEPGITRWESRLAHVAHALLYLLPFAVMLSGYLITTAEGAPVDVFGLFSVPALFSRLPDPDLAGEVHYVLAVSLISLAGLHALAAFKHHFFDRNRTLLRMFIPVRKPPKP